MHLKRNIEAPVAVAPPVAPAPVPTAPKAESTPASVAPSPPKTSPGKTNPFTNIPVEKSRKLAALEASGASGYVLVASPTVCVTKPVVPVTFAVLHTNVMPLIAGRIIPKGQNTERKETASKL